MQHFEPNPRARQGDNSGGDDDRPLRVTEDLARSLVKELERVKANRAGLRDKEADLIDGLKARGFASPAIKLGLRLRKMEAKDRDPRDFVEQALRMTAGAADGSDEAHEISAVVDELEAIRAERKELNGDKAAIVATAVEHGIPPAALEIIMRMHALDPPTRHEFFEAVEALADKLGYTVPVEY